MRRQIVNELCAGRMQYKRTHTELTPHITHTHPHTHPHKRIRMFARNVKMDVNRICFDNSTPKTNWFLKCYFAHRRLSSHIPVYAIYAHLSVVVHDGIYHRNSFQIPLSSRVNVYVPYHIYSTYMLENLIYISNWSRQSDIFVSACACMQMCQCVFVCVCKPVGKTH